MSKNKQLEHFDIDVRPGAVKKFASTAVRKIHCGGERIKTIEIWRNDVGEAHTIRIIYK